jgi:putative peptidoglycan lipid II flippase
MDIKRILLGRVGKASALLAFFSIVAKVTGFWRDRILAGQFGASRDLDIYYSAFKLPDLIFNLFILGAVSSAFIPVFIEEYRQDQPRAWRTARNFANIGFIAVLIAVILAYIFITPLSHLVAPGFSADQQAVLVSLLAIMLGSSLIFAVSTVMGSVLQALERFVAFSLAPVLYNIGIILGAWYVVPVMRDMGYPPVLGLGVGVLIGGLLHLGIQLPAAMRAGFRFGAVFDVRDVSVRKIFRLMIPRTVGIGAYSIESATMNAFASLLAVGSITVFTLANNLQFVPISVIGISVATAVFPGLSSAAVEKNMAEFRSKLYASLRSTAVMAFAAGVGLAVGGRLIIGTLFQTGAFKASDVRSASIVLAIFMLGVIAQSLIPIMSRAFYALQDTRTPVVIAVFSIFVDILLALIFAFALKWGIYGLALAIALSGNINYLLLHLAFVRKYGRA